MGDSRISYYAVIILGGFILMLVEKLVSLRFPKPPAEMLDRKREVQQATDSGDWYGDGVDPLSWTL